MEVLFDQIPLAEITTSMTINSPAAVIWAMYLAVAEKQGADWKQLSGTLQNDILKEYIAQKEYIYPPEPSLRLVIDTFEFSAQPHAEFQSHLHQRVSHSRSGLDCHSGTRVHAARRHRIRRTRHRAAAWQWTTLRRSSRFSSTRTTIFSRKSPNIAQRGGSGSAIMRDRFGAQAPALVGVEVSRADRGMFAHGAAAVQQRGAHGLQALAAVMGGTQSLHTNSLDEAWALPTEYAATLALRTQQIIAHECGVTAPPIRWAAPTLSNRSPMRSSAARCEYIAKIDALGGMVPAIERSYPQREIAEASYRYQHAVDRKEKIIVGVNDILRSRENPIEVLQIDEAVASPAGAAAARLRAERSGEEVRRRLDRLMRAAEGSGKSDASLYDAVKAYATLGEICDALRTVFGAYEEVPSLSSLSCFAHLQYPFPSPCPSIANEKFAS